MSEYSVELKGLNKVYSNLLKEDTIALKDINLQIRPGEFISIIGPSGCGSSTNSGPFRPLKEQRRDTPWKAASWTCCGRSPRASRPNSAPAARWWSTT